MEIINYSGIEEWKLRNWLPRNLKIDSVVFLPDTCPGMAKLPTGTVVLTRQSDWRKYAVSDVGCGMALFKSKVNKEDFNKKIWDQICLDLKANKNKLGDLGSGNHFLDAISSEDDNFIYFLIHTGSRLESKTVEPLVNEPEKFDEKFLTVTKWAKDNREAIGKILEKYFGKLDLIFDKSHNSYEINKDGSVIIRKGAVKLLPGELNVIPSNMNGEIVLVEAKENISKLLFSMSHGTGRLMSRSDAKEISDAYDYEELRKDIYIPDIISDSSIQTEAPFCYRNIEDCIELIKDVVIVKQRFKPFAYIGQL